MSLQDGVHLPERGEVLFREETSLAPGSIEDWTGMALHKVREKGISYDNKIFIMWSSLVYL